jgi:hypothetical protein
MLPFQAAHRGEPASQRDVSHAKADNAVTQIGRQMIVTIVVDSRRADRNVHRDFAPSGDKRGRLLLPPAPEE